MLVNQADLQRRTPRNLGSDHDAAAVGYVGPYQIAVSFMIIKDII